MIGLFLVTHSSSGESLIQCACHVLNKRPAQIVQLGLTAQDDPLDSLPLARSMLKLVDSGDGVLILTDVITVPMLTIATLIIVFISNAVNITDGLDSLAGWNLTLSFAAYGVMTFLAEPQLTNLMAFCFTLVGACAAFLWYNAYPAQVFMGDTGSLMLGIVNSVLVIKFIQVATVPTAKVFLPAAPAIGFAILFVPLFDTLRIFAYRILSRRSPFSPDRNHVHHLLLEKGCSHNMVAFLAVSFNVLIIALTFFSRTLGNTILLLGLVSIGFSTISLLIYTNRAKRRQLYHTLRGEKGWDIETKVITLKTGTTGMEAEEMAK